MSGSEHTGPYLTTVTRHQYGVRTEMSSFSQNSPSEAVRPPLLTLARIPVGRHTVVGSDMVPVPMRDTMTWTGVGAMQRGPFNSDNCSLFGNSLRGDRTSGLFPIFESEVVVLC